MTIAELKLEIIKDICSIQDVSLLEKIKHLLLKKDNYIEYNETLLTANEAAIKYENTPNLVDKEVHIFTPEQRRRIEKSLKQVENGECISDEEAQKEIEKWFEEQE